SVAGFAQVHIEPHCEDGGLSIGAATYLYHHLLDKPRRFADGPTSRYAMLGPRHDTARKLEKLKSQVNDLSIVCSRDWHAEAAQRIGRNEVIGVVEGRSETGPRALGHRSILAHPGFLSNWARVNAIKGREEWRPLAPVIPQHRLRDWFADGPDTSPFMLFTYTCRRERREQIPAVVPVDGTSRVQTVTAGGGSLFRVLEYFEQATGLPVLS